MPFLRDMSLLFWSRSVARQFTNCINKFEQRGKRLLRVREKQDYIIYSTIPKINAAKEFQFLMLMATGSIAKARSSGLSGHALTTGTVRCNERVGDLSYLVQLFNPGGKIITRTKVFYHHQDVVPFKLIQIFIATVKTEILESLLYLAYILFIHHVTLKKENLPVINAVVKEWLSIC